MSHRRKPYRIGECETCGRRRWIFDGWYERHTNRDDDVRVSFCSQGHAILFRIGAINAIMMDIYLPGFIEFLSNPNPFSSLIRAERR